MSFTQVTGPQKAPAIFIYTSKTSMFFHTYTQVFPSSKLEPPQRTNMSNVFFPTFTTKLIVILLAWPSIKPGPSCLSKTKRWSTQTHIFKNNNAIENILTETGVICLQSCQHLIRTAPRVCRDSWHSQTRNLRCTGSQRTLGGNIWEKKMGFQKWSRLSHG